MNQNARLVDIQKLELGNLSRIFFSLGLKPLFNLNNSLIIFCEDNSGQIHLVNRHILEHLSESPDTGITSEIFSTPVAHDLIEFTALFDRGLIPLSFYEQLDRKSKVLNLSGFAINPIRRPLIITLMIFKLNQEDRNFDHLSHLDQTDKLSAGGNFEDYLIITLKRLNQESRVLVTKISQDVNYQVAQDGQLTPRLDISVFLA